MIETESDQDETLNDGEVDKIELNDREMEAVKKVEKTATVLASLLNSISQLRQTSMTVGKALQMKESLLNQ